MTRRLAPWFGPGCALALLLFCYRPVLFGGGQFGFRDAAHYYYPLYQKVQEEWRAGRVPLWDPSENAGMPLLGNPTAAVLYPGKLAFALFSYPWATRLYAVLHTALAFGGMWVLLRGWGASAAAAGLAGLGYAFGSPVLFQYCNIIFLVGAAWVPWGVWLVDRWLRLGKLGALPGLAAVLAMMVLGGDPESAYLVGLAAGGYALLLARRRAVERRPAGEADRPGWRPAAILACVALGVAAWVGVTLGLAAIMPGFRPLPGESPWGPFRRWLASGQLPRFRLQAYEGPVPGVVLDDVLPTLVTAAWGVAGLVVLARWRRLGPKAVPLVPMLAGLAGAAALAGALAAAQLLPVAEFTGASGRATTEGPHDIYPFSLAPFRVVELVWPGLFGRSFGSSVDWVGMVLPGINHRVWAPSLYGGGLTLVLAAATFGAALGRKDGPARPPWHAWLVAIALVGLVGSFGEFGSPTWAARFSPRGAEWLGPHDSKDTNAVRLDGFVRDGDGSPYHLMSILLPGFRSFRFPSKLFTFVTLAMAALAGLGWDRVVAGESRAARRLAALGLGASAAGVVAALAGRSSLVNWFDAQRIRTLFGPLDPAAAADDVALALLHGALAFGLGWAVMARAGRRPGLAGAAAVALLALDLGWANATMVRAVPQADFESRPWVLDRIAEAERDEPAAGPYRIHRMPIWNPTAWLLGRSDDRIRDFVEWERGTIQPKYGLPLGVEYTQTLGVTELYDYSWFFAPFPRRVTADGARFLKVAPGERIVVFPRRGFDLWNSRYFIVPGLSRWDDPDRAIASFLPDARRIYPARDAFRGPGGDAAREKWANEEDVQIYRNLNAYPRAWVVHDFRFRPPVLGLNRHERKETMEEILFGDDLFWRDPGRTAIDPRRTAWIEADDPLQFRPFMTPGGPARADSVAVVEHSPTRVVLEATLERPGMVILADVFYPGWSLTVDGRPATIHRANRLMRGATVAAGTHRLIYTYDPPSFRIGAAISVGGLLALAAATFVGVRARSRPGPLP